MKVRFLPLLAACAVSMAAGDSSPKLRVANRSFGLEEQGYKGLGFRVVYHAP